MGRTLVAVPAAVVLAACQVNVDGAPCAAPGSAADCPAGQACGNDLRCSERALACAGSRCTPGAVGCSGPTGKERVVTCTAADPVCGRRAEEDCAARAMVCGVRAGAASCECPEHEGEVIAVDAGGSPAPGAPPFPSGAATPRECRFARLGDALQLAAARAPAQATVLVHGEAGAPAVFGDGGGEAWPLVVASNVALVGAAPPAGPTIVRGDPGAGALVSLAGALERVRVERPATAGGGARGPGIETSCGAAVTPSLRDVEVDGGLVLDPEGSGTTGLSAGVKVTGSCGAELVRMHATGAAGPALALALDPSGASTVTVLGGSYRGSIVGVSVAGSGKVTLAPDPETAASVVVSGNVREGVLISGQTSVVDTTLEEVLISENGGTGFVVWSANAASRLVVKHNDIALNGASRSRTYGPVPVQRQAGGILVSQLSLQQFVFAGNRIFANDHDQLAFETDSALTIAADSCGEQTNVFRCVSPSHYAIGVWGNGSVEAARNVWPGDPPSAWVSAGVLSFNSYCVAGPGVPQIPACP